MPTKFRLGSTIRLTSFANKPAGGGEAKGYSASPEDAPSDERKVFVCLMLAIEPELKEDSSPEEEQKLIRKALQSIGYHHEEDLVDGGVGTLLQ